MQTVNWKSYLSFHSFRQKINWFCWKGLYLHQTSEKENTSLQLTAENRKQFDSISFQKVKPQGQAPYFFCLNTFAYLTAAVFFHENCFKKELQ